MLTGGLVGHAVTAVVTRQLLGTANPEVHGFRPGAALVAVAFALVILIRHHVVERRSSSVLAFRVVVGQQGVLVAILAFEWGMAGRLEQIANDPWLWMGALAQLLLVGAWRLLERVAITMADRGVGIAAVQGCDFALAAGITSPLRGTRRPVARASTRAPPRRMALRGPAG